MENVANRESTGYGHPPKEYQFKPGQSGNPSGRPKNTLKDYVREKFTQMTAEQKEEFLKKISPEIQWQMGEGRPSQGIGQANDLEPIPILGGITQKDEDTGANKNL